VREGAIAHSILDFAKGARYSRTGIRGTSKIGSWLVRGLMISGWDESRTIRSEAAVVKLKSFVELSCYARKTRAFLIAGVASKCMVCAPCFYPNNVEMNNILSKTFVSSLLRNMFRALAFRGELKVAFLRFCITIKP
jgi:hypothetical protein